MAMEAMLRTPRDTLTAMDILVPSLDSWDVLLARLEGRFAMERALVEEGSVDVKAVPVDESEDIDGLSVGDTFSVTVSVVLSVSFADPVAHIVTMLCELTLIALDR